MAYLVEPVITPQEIGVMADFDIRPGNYGERLERKLSKPEDLPKRIEFLTGAPPPEAFSLGGNYMLVSPAMKAIIDSFPNTPIDYLEMEVFMQQTSHRMSYFLLDRIPRMIRFIHNQCKYRQTPSINHTKRMFMPSQNLEELVVRKQLPEDPHIWSEDNYQTADAIFGGQPGGIFFSDQLWGVTSEDFPLALRGEFIKER